jgi:G3E family GTPase
MSAFDNRVPVTIVTGFLGSGKTTLVNHILTEMHGMKLAVIENEFGDVGVDDKLIKSNKKFNTDEDIVEMLNGCICCTVRTDLQKVIKKMLIEKKLKLDGILIETTGLADPAPVAQTFFVDEEIAAVCRLDAIVTVVDARHIMQHLQEEKPEGVENESVEQLAFADVVLLNKIDLVSREEIDSVKKAIHDINITAKIHETTNSRIDPKELIGIKGFDLGAILVKEPDFLDTDGEHQHDTSVSSVAFCHKDPVNIGKLQYWIQELMEEKANDLFRYKGVINVVGEDRKFVFQGVHMLFSGEFTEEWTKDEVRDSRFVFIGRNLDKDEITNNFLGCSVDLNLRFEVGTKVLCRKRKGTTLQAYDKGVIVKQWDEGNPYRVRLDDDDLDIWAPDDVDDLIMECTPEIEAQIIKAVLNSGALSV